jgi:hypothetical protein
MKTISFTIAIKVGNEDGDRLTESIVFNLIKSLFSSFISGICKIGIKDFSVKSDGNDVKKPPQVKQQDIEEYEIDKKINVASFTSDLQKDGYKTTENINSIKGGK